MLANSAVVASQAIEDQRTGQPGAWESAAPSPLFNPAQDFLPALTPDNTEFVVLSFEGPDPYCRAGGLGVRVTELTRTIAAHGFDTHLYFVGDPNLSAIEQVAGTPLYYHRWSQWISRHHPGGVYQGEIDKLEDYRATIPHHLVHERVIPAAKRGKRVIILSEEWHTASTACDVSDALWAAGVRDKAILVWNANNTLGFENVDFERLRFTQTVCTVSRWMKNVMWSWGVNPIVIHNGIPARRLDPSPIVDELAGMAQSYLKERLTLGKVARFDPDKRWLMAVDAVAGLKRMGLPVLFIAKGGLEAHGHDVIQRALEMNLTVKDVRSDSRDPRVLMQTLLQAAKGADMLNVQFYLTEEISRALCSVADAMLQNSGREPFGLVGLEVMASGGLVFTGATGEEYARPWDNAIVLDTDDPHEIEATVLSLLSRPKDTERIRKKGIETARQFTWDRIFDLMLRRLQYLALGHTPPALEGGAQEG